MKKRILSRSAERLLRGAGLMALGAAVLAPTAPAEALVVRSDTTPTAARDTTNTFPWVGQMISWDNRASASFGLCTGQVIAPRVVLFAAHCIGGTASGNSERYGTGTGLRDMAFMFNNNNLPALRQWIGFDPSTTPIGASNEANNVYRVIDLISHPRNALNPFTAGNADVALAVLDQPVAGFNGYGMLLSPLTAVEQVELAGYGRTGTMETGQNIAVDWWRRVGANTMQFLGSDNDVFGSALFGSAPPTAGYNGDLYWMDSDSHITPRPAGDFNIFGGAALPNEVGIAQGDSGGAMWVRRGGVPLAVGVASYGYSFGGAPAAGFGRGTITAHTPLFNYWDFIVANNAYVYTAAVTGGGAWESGSTWQQMLDPNYFTVNSSGQLVNALPTTAPVSDTGAAPNVGAVRAPPATPVPNSGDQGVTGGTATSGMLVGLDGEMIDGSSLSGISYSNLAQDGTLRLGRGAQSAAMDTGVRLDGAGFGQLTGLDGSVSAAPLTQAIAPVEGPIAASSGFFPVGTTPLSGPGSTNFVPNNTNGTPGTVFTNAARFFEVQLVNSGTVTLSSARTIDRLRIMNAPAGLTINSGASLTTVMGSSLEAGALTVNGTLRARGVSMTGGLLSGSGLIQASGGVGVSGAAQTAGVTTISGGLVSPGGAGAVGTLTFQGNVGMGAGAQTWIDIASATSNDQLVVANLAGVTSGTNGGLAVNGALGLNFLGTYRPTFNSSWTIASSAGATSGAFTLAGTSSTVGLLRPIVTTNANSVTVQMQAIPFSSFINRDSQAQNTIGTTLDQLRTNYTANSALFDSLDVLTPDQAKLVLEQMAPNDNLAGRQLTLASLGSLGEVLFERSMNAQLGGSSFAGSFSSGAALALNGAMGGQAAVPGSGSGTGPAIRPMGDGWSAFVDVRRVEGTASPSAAFSGANLDGTVTTFGVDFAVERGMTLGLAAQLTDAESVLGANAASAASNGGQYGGYISYTGDSGWLFDGHLALGSVDLDLGRVVGASRLQGETSADAFTIGAAAAKVFQANRVGIVPRLAIDHTSVTIEGYTERGGPAALIVSQQSSNLTTASLGATLFTTFGSADGLQIQPRVTANALWNLDDEAEQIAGAAFASAPSAQFQSITGSAADNQWYEVSAGADFQFSNRVVLSASYATDLNRDTVETETVRLAARVRF